MKTTPTLSKIKEVQTKIVQYWFLVNLQCAQTD